MTVIFCISAVLVLVLFSSDYLGGPQHCAGGYLLMTQNSSLTFSIVSLWDEETILAVLSLAYSKPVCQYWVKTTKNSTPIKGLGSVAQNKDGYRVNYRKDIYISNHTLFPSSTSAFPIVLKPILSYLGTRLSFAINTIRSYFPFLRHIEANSASKFNPIEAPRKSLSTQSVWAQIVVVPGTWVVRDAWV